jgi:hypothetical protein
MKSNMNTSAITKPYTHVHGKAADSRMEKRMIHRHERHRVKQHLQKIMWEAEE